MYFKAQFLKKSETPQQFALYKYYPDGAYLDEIERDGKALEADKVLAYHSLGCSTEFDTINLNDKRENYYDVWNGLPWGSKIP